jgi:DNA-binding transcriptional regulator LsrR (DeoR family)
MRICVAGGPAKITAIRGTLHGGYVTHLVTDVKTAEALLDG